MIPFSLEEYIKNPSRKIMTRDGQQVTKILCTDAKGPFPIVALVENPYCKIEAPLSFNNKGRYSSGGPHSNDLFFVTQKHEGWINIYKHNGERHESGGWIFKTKEEAKASSMLTNGYQYQTTIKIEWEE